MSLKYALQVWVKIPPEEHVFELSKGLLVVFRGDRPLKLSRKVEEGSTTLVLGKGRGKVDRFLNHAAVMLSLDPLHKQHCLGNLGTGVKNENKQIGFRDINPLFVIQANIYMTTN